MEGNIRAYTHIAEAKKAKAYLKKMQNSLRVLERDGFKIDRVHYFIEAELIKAHLSADELDYKTAVGIVDDTLDKYEASESYAIQKARSAKGHIMTICGRPRIDAYKLSLGC